MKLNELIKDFKIFMTNEEKVELESLSAPIPYASLTGRQQVIIDNLIRKSLVSKTHSNNTIMVAKNDKQNIT
jgi:hypothetical protein|tara:strand:- start:2929 stop:3144 length:216 start_codon:yes stop_codon:yes gene_type:complete